LSSFAIYVFYFTIKDDEDDYNDTANNSLFDTDRSREEKRRISHTAAEQKRRNAIKVIDSYKTVNKNR